MKKSSTLLRLFIEILLIKFLEGKNMNAILAAILSFFIPGLGQAISGDIQKGIIFFVLVL